MKASFETPVAVPAVPCLNNKKPAAWTGRLFNTGADTTYPFTTAATKTGSFAIGWQKLTVSSTTGVIAAPSIPSTAVIAKVATTADYKWDVHSGWLQVSSDDAATTDVWAKYQGVGHVFGLMGQEADADLATTKTWMKAKKAFRFYKAATAATEKRHYMMIGLYPYDYGLA